MRRKFVRESYFYDDLKWSRRRKSFSLRPYELIFLGNVSNLGFDMITSIVTSNCTNINIKIDQLVEWTESSGSPVCSGNPLILHQIQSMYVRNTCGEYINVVIEGILCCLYMLDIPRVYFNYRVFDIHQNKYRILTIYDYNCTLD